MFVFKKIRKQNLYANIRMGLGSYGMVRNGNASIGQSSYQKARNGYSLNAPLIY